MGKVTFTEWTCDNCGAMHRIEHPMSWHDDDEREAPAKQDHGWREIAIEKPDVYGGDTTFMLCPACAMVLCGALAKMLTGGDVTVDGKRMIVELTERTPGTPV